MRKVIDFIVNKRIMFIVLFVLMAIISGYLFTKVNVNNDFSVYLDPVSDTRIALSAMNEEFKSTSSYNILVEDISTDEVEVVKNILIETDGVTTVIYNEENNYKDGNAIFAVYLDNDSFSDEAKATVKRVDERLEGYTFYKSGSVIESQFLGDAVIRNMIQILLWSSIIIIIIIFLNSKSWIEPVLFVVVIFISIVINLGTNAFFSSISFITESICAIMQLALAMDYSIMFLHRYMALIDEYPDISAPERVKKTLHEVYIPILSSSLTTVAGLLALVTMRFRLGLDIGVVLAKGIVISLLSTLLFMPGIIILFSKAIEKTRHRNLYTILMAKFPTIKEKMAKFQFKARFVIPSIIVVLVVFGAILNFQTKFAYSLEASSDPESDINVSINKIEETFGIQNRLCLLVPYEDVDSYLDTEKELVNYLNNYEYEGRKVFNSTIGLESIHYYNYYNYQELSDNFNIPVVITKALYESMDSKATEETKFQVKDVLEYLTTSTFLDDYFNRINNILINVNNVLVELDSPINPDLLASSLNAIVGQPYFNKDQMTNLVKDIFGEDYLSTSTRALISSLVNDNYLYNALTDLYTFDNINKDLDKVHTKAEIVSLFNLPFDISADYDEGDSLATVITKINSNHDVSDLTLFNKYYEVLILRDKELTINEVVTEDEYKLYIFPRLLYTLIYLFNNKLTFGEIVSKLTNLDLIKEYYEKSDFSNYASYLEYLDNSIKIELISDLINIDEEQISSILESFDIALSNIPNTVNSIVTKNSVLLFKDTLSNKLNDSVSLLEYGLSQFQGKKYNRIITNIDLKRVSDDQSIVIRNVKNELKASYNGILLVGENSSTVDFEDTFQSDSVRINLLSFGFILVIIAVSFKSLVIPLLLTLLIEGAIWVTMGLTVISGHNEYFICYLMVVCIQMGTTIDYGILLTSKYLKERKNNDRLLAMQTAYSDSFPTIITSGMILVLAAFVVGKISEVSIISSIGFLLSQGSLISLTFILIALPSILILVDKIIIRKKKKD